MFRQIIAALVISPLALSLAAQVPAQAQVQAANCNQVIAQGAYFRTNATYPQDPNVYSGTLRITQVSGSTWAGVLNLGSNENVRGTISGTEFILRRREGQTWSATCSADGISGNFTKDGLSAVGSFVLIPQ